MIEKLYNEDEGKIGTMVDKINEMIDEINRLHNHYHVCSREGDNTSYPTYGKVSELKPGDGS